MNEPAFTFVAVKSLLIWVWTNIIAAVSYCIYMLASGGREPLSTLAMFGVILLVGLVFSFTANIFLVPALYLLNMFHNKWYRLAYSIGIVLFVCWMVVLFFTQYFNVPMNERTEIIVFLSPYIIGAEVSFIVVARKLIFGDLATIPSTNPSEKI